MEIDFIGVGEAFEPQLGNCSFLVKSQSCLMIDCGYGVPRLLFERNQDANEVDAIYLTHFHADHFFGLPAVLNYWKEEGRDKALTFIGQIGIEQKVLQLLELAYPGMVNNLSFDLNFIENETSLTYKEWTLEFAKTDHSMQNFAVKLEAEGIKVGISGDGDLTDDSKKLFQDCQLLIHDAYYLQNEVKGHSTAESVIAFAQSLKNLKFVAFVHIYRKERQKYKEDFLKLQSACSFKVLVPQPAEILEL